jgi:hypothetical protein
MQPFSAAPSAATPDPLAPDPTRAPFRARAQLAGAAFSLFVIACATPALEVTGKEHTSWWGAQLLWMGVFGPFIGQFAWFANVFLAVALVLVLVGALRGAATTALLGLIVANHVWWLFGVDIPGDEGGVTHYRLQALQVGAWLWLLSFALLVVGALVLRRRAGAAPGR